MDGSALNRPVSIIALITLLCALAGCEEPPPPPPRPAVQPTAEPDPPEVVAARQARMASFLSKSRCAEGAKASLWLQNVDNARTSYIEGRLAESILSAQRAFEQCDDPDLIRHVVHCYETLGMPDKAAEANRRLRKKHNAKRRIEVTH
jgi:hypothetical protein